jgi:hypothetical protein
LYAVVATTAGRELGQVVGVDWKRIELASSSIAGPVEVPNGDVFLGVDSVLVRLAEPQVMLEGMPAVSCLGRFGDSAYACTREGVSSMVSTGIGPPIFQLSSMSPPDLTKVAAEQQSLCTSQWEHFRFDLLALGVQLTDPPPVTADAGQPTAAGGAAIPGAGSVAASAGFGGMQLSAAGAGVAATPMKPAASGADSGCSVVGPFGALTGSRAAQQENQTTEFRWFLASLVTACASLARRQVRADRRRLRAGA